MPALHQYVVTEQMDEVAALPHEHPLIGPHPGLPNMRLNCGTANGSRSVCCDTRFLTLMTPACTGKED